MNVKERFLNYVVIDSGSSETSGTHPSTEKQWDMARLLEKELKGNGRGERPRSAPPATSTRRSLPMCPISPPSA